MTDESEILRRRAARAAQSRRWREKNREAHLEYCRAYSKTPKVRARAKAYREKHREEINAQRRAWRAANAETYRAKRRILAAKERQRKREREAADPAYAAEQNFGSDEAILRNRTRRTCREVA